MLISVIIPVFNVAKFLEKCVLSIAKNYENLEIILIDDGSSDGSGELCEILASKDGRIRVIHQKNSGVGAARNAGLNVAKGDYIAFVDSDDSVESGYFAHMSDKIASADVAIFSLREFKGSDFVLDGIGAVKYLLLNQKHEFGWYVWNKLFSRTAIGEIRFDEREHLMEDFSFVSKVLVNSASVRFCDGGLYNYAENENSLTRASYGAKFDSLLLVQDNFLSLAREKNLSEFAYFFIAQSTLYLIYRARQANKWDKVRELSARLRKFLANIIFKGVGGVKFKAVVILHALFENLLIFRAKFRGKN